MLRRFAIILLLFLSVAGASAQSWKSAFGGIIDKVEKTVSTVNRPSIVGTWRYVNPDCKFESDDLLAKAGGEIAAKKVEEQMSTYLSKLGFNKSTVYTFNADSTYISTVNGRTVKGTYSFNNDTKEVTLKTRLGVKFSAEISNSILDGGNKISILFKADKLMSLAQTVTGTVADKISNNTVASLSSLLENYDGMMIGFEMQKEDN